MKNYFLNYQPPEEEMSDSATESRGNYDDLPFHGGVPKPSTVDATITKDRWNASDFVYELWKSLADRTPKVNDDGSVVLVRETPGLRPPMNDKGAKDIIRIVTSYINPVVSLSNISDEDARALWGRTMKRVAKVIALKQDAYEIEDASTMVLIMKSIDTLLFCQIMRSVEGWEAKQHNTSVQEVNHNHMQEQRYRSSWFRNGGK